MVSFLSPAFDQEIKVKVSVPQRGGESIRILLRGDLFPACLANASLILVSSASVPPLCESHPDRPRLPVFRSAML